MNQQLGCSIIGIAEHPSVISCPVEAFFPLILHLSIQYMLLASFAEGEVSDVNLWNLCIRQVSVFCSLRCHFVSPSLKAGLSPWQFQMIHSAVLPEDVTPPLECLISLHLLSSPLQLVLWLSSRLSDMTSLSLSLCLENCASLCSALSIPQYSLSRCLLWLSLASLLSSDSISEY